MGNLGEQSPGRSIVIGILVGLLSTNVQSIGLTLQRKSHLLEDKKSSYDARRPPYRRRRWQIGMAMFIIANLIGSTIQITTLPLPVLSTLQASGLVFNSICASFILGEPFDEWSLGGTLLVVSGAILIAIFGAIPEPAHSLDQLLFLFARRTFIIWMTLQVFLVVGIITIASLLSRMSSLASNPRILLFRGLAYGVISGILSAHSLLIAKLAVELLVYTIFDRVNQFNRWQSWATLLSLVFLALTQLYYLHRGLKLVSTSVLYPLVFCIYNIIAIIDGLIYFKQTDRLSSLSACLIILGTIILLSGVLALSWRLSDTQSPRSIAKSALVPGLGLIEDTDTENDDYSDSIGIDEDETMDAERRPLLAYSPESLHLETNSPYQNKFYTQESEQLVNTNEGRSPSEQDNQFKYKLWSFRFPKRFFIFPISPAMQAENQIESFTPTRWRIGRSSGLLGFSARSTKTTKRSIKNESYGEFWKMKWLSFNSDKYNGSQFGGDHLHESSISDNNGGAEAGPCA